METDIRPEIECVAAVMRALESALDLNDVTGVSVPCTFSQLLDQAVADYRTARERLASECKSLDIDNRCGMGGHLPIGKTSRDRKPLKRRPIPNHVTE